MFFLKYLSCLKKNDDLAFKIFSMKISGEWSARGGLPKDYQKFDKCFWNIFLLVLIRKKLIIIFKFSVENVY